MLTKEGILLTWRALILIGVTVGIVELLAVRAQPEKAKEPTLTALDYVEIQQLNAHYPDALDACAGNGEEYADLFTSDGVFNSDTTTQQGHEALMAMAGQHLFCGPPRTPPLTVRHISANVMIEPSPEGAIGKSDLLFVTIGPDGWTGKLDGGGKYYDVYVRTPKGWRIKLRQFLAPNTKNIVRIPASELSKHPLPHPVPN